MLRNFQPFIDYKKLIQLQSQGSGYQLSKKDRDMNNYKQPLQAKRQNQKRLKHK